MKKLTTKILAVLAAVILLTAVLAPTAFALGGGFDLGTLTDFGEILGEYGGLSDIIGQIIGGGNNNGGGIALSDIFANPNGILDILQERLANIDVSASRGEIANAIYALLQDTDPGDLTSLLASNEFLNQLAEYLKMVQAATATETDPPTDYYTVPTTTEPEEEDTTEEPTTEEPTTEEPTTATPTTYEVPTVIIPSTYVYQGADTYSTQPTQTTTEPVYSYVQPATQYTDPVTTVPFTPAYEDTATTAAANNSAKLMIGAVVVLLSAGAIVVVVVMLKKTKA